MPQQLTESENGKTIKAAVGDVIHIKLPANPSTGYKWVREGFGGDEFSDNIFAIKHKFNSPESHLLGGVGAHHFEVSPRVVGENELVLVYIRPWESPKANSKRYTLKVVSA